MDLNNIDSNSVPKVSVVIPLYNKEHYIKQTINSVLNQKLTDFELIIVNDGSTDNSVEVVKQFSDKRIRLINQKNGGQAKARNTGIKNAKADFVAFLDADDEWYENHLQSLYDLYQQYPEAGAYGVAYSVFMHGKHQRDNVWEPEKGARIIPFFRDMVEYGRSVFTASTVAYSRKVLIEIKGCQEDYRSGPDLDMIARAALLYPVCYTPEITARYNAGAENNFDRVNFARESALVRYLSTLPESEREKYLAMDGVKLFIDFYLMKVGGINIYGGFKKEGRKQVKMVTEPSMNKKRMMFLIMSYIPFPYHKLSPNLIRNVANKLNLAT